MKANVHPEYGVATVKCGCGATFQTRSTRPAINVEICASCHPFFTGVQKFVDTAGRIEKFNKKYAKVAATAAKAAETVKKKA